MPKLTSQKSETTEILDSLRWGKTSFNQYSYPQLVAVFTLISSADKKYSKDPAIVALTSLLSVRIARLQQTGASSVMIKEEELDACHTLEPFKDPVVADDGYIYENENIRKWFEVCNFLIPSPEAESVRIQTRTLIPFPLIKQIVSKGAPYFISEKDLFCPLTKKFMHHPVLASNGILYERAAIESELAKNPRAEQFAALSDQLIIMPWVNRRRDELIQQYPHLSVRPPVEQRVKSTYSTVLASLIEESKPLANTANTESTKTEKLSHVGSATLRNENNAPSNKPVSIPGDEKRPSVRMR